MDVWESSVSRPSPQGLVFFGGLESVDDFDEALGGIILVIEEVGIAVCIHHFVGLFIPRVDAEAADEVSTYLTTVVDAEAVIEGTRAGAVVLEAKFQSVCVCAFLVDGLDYLYELLGLAVEGLGGAEPIEPEIFRDFTAFIFVSLGLCPFFEKNRNFYAHRFLLNRIQFRLRFHPRSRGVHLRVRGRRTCTLRCRYLPLHLPWRVSAGCQHRRFRTGQRAGQRIHPWT